VPGSGRNATVRPSLGETLDFLVMTVYTFTLALGISPDNQI